MNLDGSYQLIMAQRNYMIMELVMNFSKESTANRKWGDTMIQLITVQLIRVEHAINTNFRKERGLIFGRKMSKSKRKHVCFPVGRFLYSCCCDAVMLVQKPKRYTILSQNGSRYDLFNPAECSSTGVGLLVLAYPNSSFSVQELVVVRFAFS